LKRVGDANHGRKIISATGPLGSLQNRFGFKSGSMPYKSKDGHPDLWGFGDGKKAFFWISKGSLIQLPFIGASRPKTGIGR
jgi:hypothetical protein